MRLHPGSKVYRNIDDKEFEVQFPTGSTAREGYGAYDLIASDGTGEQAAATDGDLYHGPIQCRRFRLEKERPSYLDEPEAPEA